MTQSFDAWEGGRPSSTTLHIDHASLRAILPTVFLACDFAQWDIQDGTRAARATRATNEPGHFAQSSDVRAFVRWSETKDGLSTLVQWEVYRLAQERRTPDPQRQEAFGAALALEAGRHYERQAIERLERDPVAAPGFPYERPYVGTLRDYSGCADRDEAKAGLLGGIFPVGRHQFGEARSTEPELTLNQFGNGAPMEYNGVLLCAPQNSGKTNLIIRWAQAAAGSTAPYATFIVDVKGNMPGKLKELKGTFYRFSTDPDDRTSDRINFLAGPTGLTPESSDRIRQIATAILPSRGFVEAGGNDAYHYRNRVTWLTAFIHILKLARIHKPDNFLDLNRQPRDVDLCDLYEMVASEDRLSGWINYILEQENRDPASSRDEHAHRPDDRGPGIRHWSDEIAIMLSPAKVPGGQRPEKDRYPEYTHGIISALEPFSVHGTLHRRVRSYDVSGGDSRLFDLEQVMSEPRREPVTVIMVARQQDLDRATTILSLTIKRLQWLLFGRMAQDDAHRWPVLLLLDETRRIPDFDAAEYVTFAREAKACCVVAYQSLDQVGKPQKVVELLENVGTQIYLGSLAGNTARHFTGILPSRSRMQVTRQVTQATNATTVSSTTSTTDGPYFTTAELGTLPAGRWPAMVYINDQPRRKPIITSLDLGPDLTGTTEPARAPAARSAAVGAAARRLREQQGGSS